MKQCKLSAEVCTDVQKAVMALLLGAVPGVVHRRRRAGCWWPGPGPGAPSTGPGRLACLLRPGAGMAGITGGRRHRSDPGMLVCKGQVCVDAKQAAVESG